MRVYSGLDIGAISERLKAPIILMISARLASVWFLLSSLTYQSRQLASILKSQIFSLMRSPRSTDDCFRLVTVELPLTLDSSMFLVRLITLTVCLPFFAFLTSAGSIFLFLVLLNLDAELARCMDTAKEFKLSFLRMAEDSRSSVLTLLQLGVREGFWQSDPFFLCLGSNCWLMDCWWEKERLLGWGSEILMRWIDIFNILLNFITPPPHYQHSQKMIQTSKKNLQPHPKMHSQHAKALKRSKSSEHLLPKKTAKRPQDRTASEQPHHSQSLTKSKSTKSLKPKSKHSSKPSQSIHKKPKGKKSECKTVKKLPLRQSNEVSSILTEEWEPKKPMLEYFVYQNNYIAIENSAQRRLVYKIQMIDLENKSTTSSFAPKKSEPKAVGTDAVSTEEAAVNAVELSSYGQTQTDPIPEPQPKKFQETVAKCFVDVLTELEFLFLPNEDNFKPFTQNERVHYGELLEVLAKKMLSGGKQIVEEVLTEEQITVLLFQREGIQMGALEFIPLEGFPTHVLSILAYLKNLFCFVEYGFKEEVLAGLRHFYGFNYNERISRLSRGQSHEKDIRLALSEDLFQAFENQMFKDYEFHSPIAKDAVHAHNRAIFDSVNNELQAFRPFYSSQGQPFPWTNNLGMTHYDITEQALYIIFVQVKDKIQRQVSTLCGMHLDFDDDSIPRAQNSHLYQKKMQQRQEKMLFEQAKQWDDRIQLDYYSSSLLFSISQDILEALMLEAAAETSWLDEATDEQEFEFQYFN